VLGHQPGSLGALHEGDHGIMPVLEVLRQIREGGPSLSREAGNSEKELVLERSDTTLTGSVFAEAQEDAKPVSKPREVSVKSWRDRCRMAYGHPEIYITW